MLNISREKVNRNYYMVSLMSHYLEQPRLVLYVEIRESELRKHAGRMRTYIEESVKSFAKIEGWKGMGSYEFTMFHSSTASRIDKLESKYN